MSMDDEFLVAKEAVMALPSATPDQMLKLYGLFKQATAGDVIGDRPGMLDIRGRAKHDAWSAHAGLSEVEAKQEYVEYVNDLLGDGE